MLSHNLNFRVMKKSNVLEQAAMMMGKGGWLAVCAAALAAAATDSARGCACGCGVFDVATEDMFPRDSGAMAYIMYDFSDQNHNWSQNSMAPADENGDKRIETQFTTYGFQYMFNAKWGVQVEAPYDYRTFSTTTANPNAVNPVVKLNWSCLGDVRVGGIYTGFSPDLSTGVTYGLKLPTGDFSHNNPWGDIDRDSEIGAGSTDVLLGFFHRHKLATCENWNWYAQALLDVPVLIQDHYRPGVELDTAAGLYYTGWTVGKMTITPLEQLIVSERTSDTGYYASGNPGDGGGGSDSGYQRVMFAQGFELHMYRVPLSFYADVEVPVFQDFRGNQMAATQLFKAMLNYHF